MSESIPSIVVTVVESGEIDGEFKAENLGVETYGEMAASRSSGDDFAGMN